MSKSGYKEDSWRGRLTHGAPLAVLLAAGLFLAYKLLFILELIAIAVLVALLLRSLVKWLSNYGVKPWMSAFLILGVFLAFGAFAWFFVVPSIVEEVQRLFLTTSDTLNEAERQSRQRQGIFSVVPNMNTIIDQAQSYLDQLRNRLPQLVPKVFDVGLDVIAALFLALYMAIDSGTPVKAVLRLVPGERREGAREFLKNLEERLRGWMVGTGIAMLFVGVLAGLGLWLIGVPLPITFGIIAGILNVIPFLGSILGALLPALVALTISPLKAVLVLALFLVINQIDGNVIQPLVMGSQASVHPVLVLVSFLLFGALLGPTGLLLAVPAVILLMTTLNWTVLDEPSEEPEVEEVEEPVDKGSDAKGSDAGAGATDTNTEPVERR